MALQKPKQAGIISAKPTKAGPQIPVSANKKSKVLAPPTVAKKFTIEEWGDDNDGEKIMIYGDTGIGKSSLSIIAPKPVFLGLDDGGRKLRHPVTGDKLKTIPGLATFADVRAALQQVELYDDYETAVIDTVTVLEDWAVPYMLQTIPTEKGQKASSILSYGWGKGYQHLYDIMKLILQDCDTLIRRGKNVIFIAQGISSKVANASGEDFFRHGPRLHDDRKYSVEALYCEWCDHIFRVDYHNTFVQDKKISGTTDRAVFVQPELHFRAKSRTISEPVISYENNSDSSVWKFLFNKGEK